MTTTFLPLEGEQGQAEVLFLMTCHAIYSDIFKAFGVRLGFCSKSSLNWNSCCEGTSHIHGDAQASELLERLYMFPKMSVFLSNIGIAGEEM